MPNLGGEKFKRKTSREANFGETYHDEPRPIKQTSPTTSMKRETQPCLGILAYTGAGRLEGDCNFIVGRKVVKNNRE